jgi:hypothetical protein
LEQAYVWELSCGCDFKTSDAAYLKLAKHISAYSNETKRSTWKSFALSFF